MKGFAALHGRRLFDHPLRIGLTLSGIGGASALLVAVLALSNSLTGSIARTAAIAGRADVAISGVTDTGFDERLFFDVERTPGVRAAVPFVESPIVVGTTRAVLLGFDERARVLGGSGTGGLDRQLNGPDVNLNGIFVGPGLARLAHLHTGQTALTGGPQTGTRVLGRLPASELTSLNQGVVALAALPVAQRLVGRPHRLDGIYVLAERGVPPAVLQRRLTVVFGDRVVVSSPRLLADQAASAVAALRTGLLTVSILALTVAGFVVFNTMSMAALERRRELATLRALGGRRRALLTGFLAEAALLGLAGATAGAVAGSLAARALVSRVPRQIVASFDLRIGYILPTGALIVAVAAGTGLAVFAAVLPARRSVRVPPVEAMRPEGVLEAGGEADGPRWVITVLGFSTMTVGLVLALTAGVVVAIGLFWVGGLVGMYGIAGPQARVASWLAGRFRSAGRLGAAALARNPRRVYATAATVTAAVALVVGQSGTERNVNTSLRAANASVARTDLIVTTAAPDNLATDLLLPDQLATRLATLPDVSREALEQRAYAYVGVDRVELHGVTGRISLGMLSPASPAARQALLDGTAVIVTTQFAKPRHLHAGDTIELATPSGPQRLNVAAVINTFASAAGGDIALSLDHLQMWFARPGLSQIELTLQPTADRSTAEQAVANLLRTAVPNAHVETGPQRARHLAAAGAQVAGAFNAIELVIILGAGLAVLNTLAISVVERRRELAMLRAIGSSRRQLRRAVLAEAAGIGAIGAAVGLAFGVPAHYMAVLGTQQVGGTPVTYHFDPLPLALAAVAAIALTLLGCLAPAVRTGRLNVIEAIGYE